MKYQKIPDDELFNFHKAGGTANPANPANALARTATLADPPAIQKTEFVSESGVEERASIVEFDAAVPREWADGYAKLCTMPRPKTFTPERWALLVDDVGRFLDQWGVKAHELGWETSILFGAHSLKPVDRFDAMGLAVILQGREVTSVEADSISIRNRSGSVSVYRRTPGAIEGTVVWEMCS